MRIKSLGALFGDTPNHSGLLEQETSERIVHLINNNNNNNDNNNNNKSFMNVVISSLHAV